MLCSRVWRCSLRLTVSSPALLLNHVAQRYADTQRVVAEYVDNALDDSERLYSAPKGSYKRPIHIDLVVDRHARKLVVRDNAHGMDAEVLQRIVQNVGDSNKRGQAFLNGQFGFGIHAFRAAASQLQVRTCVGDEGVLSMCLDRSQNNDIDPPVFQPGRLDTDTGTGTEVTVSGFEDAWMDGLAPARITEQINHHFERLLSRNNLQVTVTSTPAPSAGSSGGVAQASRVVCRPFEYSQVVGTEHQDTFEIDGKMAARVLVKVVPSAAVAAESGAGHVSMFSNGRRVNDVCELRTFMRMSPYKGYIWAHPQLVGYIEVGPDIHPVITRDDFQRTTARAAVYKYLAKQVEPRLKLLIDQANATTYDGAVGRVERLLGKCLDASIRSQRQRALRMRRQQELQDQQSQEADNSTDSSSSVVFTNRRVRDAERRLSLLDEAADAETHVEDCTESSTASRERDAEREKENTEEAREDDQRPEDPPRLPGGLVIKFVDTLYIAGATGRARMVGTAMHINTSHPDFVSRTRFSRTGQPLFGDRLVSYLAYVVGVTYSAHRSASPLSAAQTPEPSNAYEDVIDVIANVELRLRKHFKQVT